MKTLRAQIDRCSTLAELAHLDAVLRARVDRDEAAIRALRGEIARRGEGAHERLLADLRLVLGDGAVEAMHRRAAARRGGPGGVADLCDFVAEPTWRARAERMRVERPAPAASWFALDLGLDGDLDLEREIGEMMRPLDTMLDEMGTMMGRLFGEPRDRRGGASTTSGTTTSRPTTGRRGGATARPAAPGGEPAHTTSERTARAEAPEPGSRRPVSQVLGVGPVEVREMLRRMVAVTSAAEVRGELLDDVIWLVVEEDEGRLDESGRGSLERLAAERPALLRTVRAEFSRLGARVRQGARGGR